MLLFVLTGASACSLSYGAGLRVSRVGDATVAGLTLSASFGLGDPDGSRSFYGRASFEGGVSGSGPEPAATLGAESMFEVSGPLEGGIGLRRDWRTLADETFRSTVVEAALGWAMGAPWLSGPDSAPRESPFTRICLRLGAGKARSDEHNATYLSAELSYQWAGHFVPVDASSVPGA